MKIGIISGSHRGCESLKLATYISGALPKVQGPAGSNAATTYLLDLGGNPLPLWDEERWQPQNPRWTKIWGPISTALKGCDGFVIISPEWSGMVPAGLKNFFLHCSDHELAHKPGFIVSISSGMGGAYPVAELRMSSYKNTYLNYMPEHFVIREVTKYFNDPVKSTSDVDTYLRKRLDYNLQQLLHYAAALGKVRASGILNLKEYPFGM